MLIELLKPGETEGLSALRRKPFLRRSVEYHSRTYYRSLYFTLGTFGGTSRTTRSYIPADLWLCGSVCGPTSFSMYPTRRMLCGDLLLSKNSTRLVVVSKLIIRGRKSGCPNSPAKRNPSGKQPVPLPRMRRLTQPDYSPDY